jgi:hypothetical protein
LPSTAKPPTAEPVARFQKKPVEDEAKPLKLANKFDSFDATMRLAAMTNQTANFLDYISETQKMRAYKGGIGSPAALRGTSPKSASDPVPEVDSSDTATLKLDEFGEPEVKTNIPVYIALAIVSVLAMLALGLAVALFLH